MRPRVAVDAMGGDHGPAEVVRGALLAAQRLEVEVLLVGRTGELRRHIDELPDNVTLVDAPDVIDMADKIDAVKAKPEASINV
ncbi:MAG: phosphate acyltransferase, partial [Dehalococcoidia bacterium]|nr:phosphate acyltransferase [Dehalococcoidia bacterium]